MARNKNGSTASRPRRLAKADRPRRGHLADPAQVSNPVAYDHPETRSALPIAAGVTPAQVVVIPGDEGVPP